MIVRTIRISNWRCFLSTIEIGPFDDGLNVIYAPNGTGKSTIFEALQRALLDGHRVSGKDIDAIRPWGRELTPKVIVEFVHGDQEYRITKQFINSPMALLERKENGRYRAFAEGLSADEQARQILTKNPPGRGLSRVENWGLAQVLWAPQGNLCTGPLTGDVVSDIRNMLSAQVSSSGTGPIEKRIEELYLQFFTPRGKLRTGKDAPALVRIEEDLYNAIQARQKAYETYIRFEETSRRVEDLRAKRVQIRHDEEEIKKTLAKARFEAEAYRELKAEQERRLEQVNTAEARYKGLKQEIEHIKSIEEELRDTHAMLAAFENEAPLRDKEVEARKKEAESRKTELENARKGRKDVDRAINLADEARRFNECSKELGHLRERINKINEAEENLSNCRKERNAHLSPDAKTLRAIRKAIQKRNDAQVRIEASLISIEIVPKEDCSIEVLSGETTGSVSMKAGVPTLVQGSPEVVAEIPKVARLRAWGPVGSIEEHRKAREKADQELRELTGPFGTFDLGALELLAEKGRELDGDVAKAETKLKTLLGDQALDDLLQEENLLSTKYKAFLEAHPEWADTPPSLGSLETHAEEVKQAFINQVESCEAGWEKAQGTLMLAVKQKETLSAKLEETRKQIDSLKTKLADLTVGGKPREEQEAELQRLAMAWDAARARVEEIQGKLNNYGDDPAVIVNRLENQLEQIIQESNRTREQEVREEQNLELLCAQGPYSTLASAEERIVQLEEEKSREKLRVDAFQLLYKTVASCRSKAIASVSRPVEEIASKTLQRIAGPRLGRIKIKDTFEPAWVKPEAIENTVTLDNLSGGEQEQLYLATRLALAEVLAKDERQVVVLDDVLTATDAGRLARVMNVIEETAQRLQVLILTCHPERYRGLGNGVFFDLEDLASKTTS